MISERRRTTQLLKYYCDLLVAICKSFSEKMIQSHSSRTCPGLGVGGRIWEQEIEGWGLLQTKKSATKCCCCWRPCGTGVHLYGSPVWGPGFGITICCCWGDWTAIILAGWLANNFLLSTSTRRDGLIIIITKTAPPHWLESGPQEGILGGCRFGKGNYCACSYRGWVAPFLFRGHNSFLGFPTFIEFRKDLKSSKSFEQKINSNVKRY